MNTKISAILERKGDRVWSISPGTCAIDAIGLMAREDIGALVVMRDGCLVGIVSERDYVRKIALGNCSATDVKVEEIMTRDVYTGSPEQSVADCMVLMMERRVRHLPIVDKMTVVGIISIRDIVTPALSDRGRLIEHFENFITESVWRS